MTYNEQPWHKDCFLCTGCKEQLAGQRFTSHDGFPYCLTCFCNLYAKKCASCTSPISGTFFFFLQWYPLESLKNPRLLYIRSEFKNITRINRICRPYCNFIQLKSLFNSSTSATSLECIISLDQMPCRTFWQTFYLVWLNKLGNYLSKQWHLSQHKGLLFKFDNTLVIFSFWACYIPERLENFTRHTVRIYYDAGMWCCC